jgi:hypothetical protein
MDYYENGVPMFNGQMDLSMRCGENGRKYFCMHRDIIFGYQMLQDMIVQKGKDCNQEGNEEE